VDNQLPLPDSQPEPAQPQPEQTEPAEDLTPYRRFIQHDTWQNRMKISGTELIAKFWQVVPYMEDIHRKQFEQVNERLLETGSSSKLTKPYIARTVHHQVATIIKRYLPVIKAQPRPWTQEIDTLVNSLEAAVDEAAKIEKVASQMMDEVAKTRGRGNVRFVESLTMPKKAG
jgi:3-methyladenine DNA glycosylase AlkD